MPEKQILTEEHRNALKAAFEDIDITGTGRISKSELRSVLQLTGQNPTLEEMTEYMQHAADSQFTLQELYEFIERYIPIKSSEEIDQELMDAFDKFNEDRDFRISKEEFKKIMTKLGEEPLTESDADALIQSLSNIEEAGRYNVGELAKMFMG